MGNAERSNLDVGTGRALSFGPFIVVGGRGIGARGGAGTLEACNESASMVWSRGQKVNTSSWQIVSRTYRMVRPTRLQPRHVIPPRIIQYRWRARRDTTTTTTTMRGPSTGTSPHERLEIHLARLVPATAAEFPAGILHPEGRCLRFCVSYGAKMLNMFPFHTSSQGFDDAREGFRLVRYGGTLRTSRTS
jgi:hypothetical protein